MTITECRSADRKKVQFPPPKILDPEAKWTQECVMFRTCGEKKVLAPSKCPKKWLIKLLSHKKKLCHAVS